MKSNYAMVERVANKTQQPAFALGNDKCFWVSQYRVALALHHQLTSFHSELDNPAIDKLRNKQRQPALFHIGQ